MMYRCEGKYHICISFMYSFFMLTAKEILDALSNLDTATLF